MPVFLFEGPAGSGKTTAVVSAVAEAVRTGVLKGGRRVLALTKMHGSRRRMHDKLQGHPALRDAFDCVVLDALARQVVHRWRTLAKALSSSDELETLNFDETCELAGLLLERAQVSAWLARRYGILLVDELQDCHGGQLRVLRALTTAIPCYVAGDDFQDLTATTENAAVTWARSVVSVQRTASLTSARAA